MVQKGLRLDLKRYIRSIPDFPKPGILFRDITPLLADAEAFEWAIKEMSSPYIDKAVRYVAAVEARGFIFGSAVATVLKAGFVPMRKKGKLPYQTASVSYGLEYGQDSIEIHQDAIQPGERILLVDEVLATGGTMAAACELIEKLGGEICGLSFLAELTELGGRRKLSSYPIHRLIAY